MKKILAIDDNEINLVLLNQIIKLYYSDYIFLQAVSGKEGIQKAIDELPDIILLDILMPEMDGYEVCEFLKGDTRTRHIPILMISALGQNPMERTKGLNVGADSFISKPFSQAELRAQIDVALRIKKAEDMLRKRNESLEILIKDQTTKYMQSEERFLQISEHVLEFYWEIDDEGIFTYVSPVIEKIIGENPENIIGEESYESLLQYIADENQLKYLGKCFLNKKSFKNYEIQLNVKDKTQKWLSVSGFPIYDKNDKYFGFRGVCYDDTKRKQAEIALTNSLEQIKDYQKQLKNLNVELTLVEEKERRRIAENLHDSLGQSLSLAYIKLTSIINEKFSPNVEKIINEISVLLKNAVDESRTLTYDLSPPILYELGLVPAFKWKLQEINEKHDIKTKFVSDNEDVYIRKEYNIFLFRIITELLNNVIKHSQASFVEIQVKKVNNNYYITVSDNGIGFETELNINNKLNSGFGLFSITERLDGIKGSFEIDSVPGKGTKAVVIIPANAG